MAHENWGHYGGPSSGYVRTRIYPRTDYGLWPPQAPAAEFDPTTVVAAIRQLATSYRTGHSWIRDESQAVGFVATADVAFDPTPYSGLWAHGSRMPGRDRRPRLSESPTPWVPVPIFDPQFWPATSLYGARSLWRDRRPRFSEQPTPWVPVPIFDPQLWSGTHLDGTRSLWRDQRPRLSETPPPVVPVPIFDPLFWPATRIDDTRLRPRDWWTSDPLQDAWLFTNLPAQFDPQYFPPTIQLAGSFRLGQAWTLDLSQALGFVATPDAPAFDPSLFPWVQGQSFRAPARVQDWDDHAVVTFGVPLPYGPQIEQLLAAFRARSHRQWFTADYAIIGWWVPTFTPPPVQLTGGIYIPIFRPRRR